MAARPQPPEPQIVHYVPGEICVVIEAAQVRDLPGWYEACRAALNGALRTFFADRPSWDKYGPAVRKDLEPTRLEATFGPRPGEILQPLDRDDAKVAPSAGLPGPATSTALLFYQIGTANDNLKAALLDRLEWVRELSNLVNVQVRPEIKNKEGVAGRIVAASPNWLAAGTQAEMTGGGPGSLPEPAKDGKWRFCFPNAGLDALVKQARAQAEPSGVYVAVLDTCPDRRAVEAKAAELGPDHTLYQVTTPGRSAGPAIVLDDPVDARFLHLHRFVVDWNQVPASEPDYDEHYRMADHGLFVAGVIKDIAPWAEIRITRVLNDWGVGDLLALVTALSALAQQWSGEERRRLIVNLSLMVDQPPRADLFRLLWPAASGVLPAELKHADKTAINTTLDAADVGLARAIDALPTERALVVAAAGNDAIPTLARPEPRLPARYDSENVKPNVMGVGAMTADLLSSEFSNEADVVASPQGVASFGGNAARQLHGPARILLDGAKNKDAVVGLFSANTLPISGKPNKSGWVYWAGTSFATPIISGVAADLWAAGQPAPQVVAAVQGCATAAQPPLLSKGIPAVQQP